MKDYCLLKFRVFDRDYKKLMSCKMIVFKENLSRILVFLNSNDRIVIYDEIREAEEDDLIRRMLLKVKDNLQDELF